MKLGQILITFVYDEYRKKFKLIIMQVNDQCLCTISLSTDHMSNFPDINSMFHISATYFIVFLCIKLKLFVCVHLQLENRYNDLYETCHAFTLRPKRGFIKIRTDKLP